MPRTRVRRLCTSAAAAATIALLWSSLASSTISAQAQSGPINGRAVIGTDGEDYASGVFVSPSGAIYVTGSIATPTEPLPADALGASYQGNQTADGGAYLMKLAANGSALRMSVFARYSRGEAVVLDAAGNIIVAGTTYDSAFLVTPGAFNAGPSVGPRAFVIKLTPDASSLVYSAILGPVRFNDDVGAVRTGQVAGPSVRIAVDADGNALVAGTAVAGFPTTSAAFDRTFGGDTEAFVAKLAGDGSLVYSTYLGGADGDEAHGLVVDGSGNAIVSGTTGSADFPTTTLLHGGSVMSAFVAGVASDGQTLQFATRVTGESGASGRGVALGPDGDIYLSGTTQSTDFPTTAAPFDLPWEIRRAEGFVMRLTPHATAIVYSTSLAGSMYLDSDRPVQQGSHTPISIAVDAQGRAIVVGASGAGSNIYTGRTTAFKALVAANGASFTAELTGSRTDNGSAAYDVTANAAGDVASVTTTNTWFDVTGVSPAYGKSEDTVYSNNEDMLPGGMPPDGLVDWTAVPPPNTPAGGTVTVAAAGNTSSVTFDNVITTGVTTVTPADPATLNLSMPGGFALSGLVQPIEIHTTATVSGIQVCMNGAALSDAEFANASILHGVNGAWQVEPTIRNAATKTLCATVASLSPFAVGIRTDTTAPTVTCAAAPTAWTGGPVTIQCSSLDQGGLASAADALFTLTATLAAGLENASVPTGTRQVCDTSGNCTTAGPVNVKIDRRAPSIVVTAPTSRRYTLNQAVLASYTCADGGSGIATCTGTVASGARLNTAAAGANTFAVDALDVVGNAAATTVAYTVGYNVKILLSPTVKRSAPATVAVQLVDANNVNVSSAAIAVRAVGLKQLSSGSMIAPATWMPSTGAAFTFRVSGSTSGYRFQVTTKGLTAGTYALQFTAAGDATVQTVPFTVR